MAADGGHGPRPERPPHHGSVGEQRLPLGAEQIEAGGDERADRVGRRQFGALLEHGLPAAAHQQVAVLQQADQLLGEQRVAAGALEQRGLEADGQRLGAQAGETQPPEAAVSAEDHAAEAREGGAGADGIHAGHAAGGVRLGPGPVQQVEGRVHAHTQGDGQGDERQECQGFAAPAQGAQGTGLAGQERDEREGGEAQAAAEEGDDQEDARQGQHGARQQPEAGPLLQEREGEQDSQGGPQVVHQGDFQ